MRKFKKEFLRIESKVLKLIAKAHPIDSLIFDRGVGDKSKEYFNTKICKNWIRY